MNEPSAEAREILEPFRGELLVDEVMMVLRNRLTRALAEKDAELAEHEHCIEEIERDQLHVAERENELSKESDAKIAALQADLAAMREALERIKREAGANMAGDSVSVAEEAFRMLDRIEEWATVALASSPAYGSRRDER